MSFICSYHNISRTKIHRGCVLLRARGEKISQVSPIALLIDVANVTLPTKTMPFSHFSPEKKLQKSSQCYKYLGVLQALHCRFFVCLFVCQLLDIHYNVNRAKIYPRVGSIVRAR